MARSGPGTLVRSHPKNLHAGEWKRRSLVDARGGFMAVSATSKGGAMEMSAITSAEPDELLRKARAGSRPALGQLLDMYTPYLTLLARLQIGRKLQGKADPADVVQEAFLAAHAHFGKFRGT